MTFALVLAGAFAFTFACRRPLRLYPLVFYALAVGCDVLFVVGSFVPLPSLLNEALFLLLHKCTLATALFTVVMFIGVFARDSKVGMWLRPVRAELSIIAWILSLGHMTIYFMSYAPRVLAGGGLQSNVALSFVVAIVLFALLLVLGITSFNVVKKRMKADAWRRVQLLAYPFFGLVYVHLLLMLLPSALRGGAAAQVSVAVYSAVFVGYAVLRVVRAVKDRHLAKSVPVPAW